MIHIYKSVRTTFFYIIQDLLLNIQVIPGFMKIYKEKINVYEYIYNEQILH